MTLPSWAIATIRTLTQSAVAWLLSSTLVLNALSWVESTVGLSVSEEALTGFAFGVAIAIVTALVNYLGKLSAFQWINKVFSIYFAKSPALYDKA